MDWLYGIVIFLGGVSSGCWLAEVRYRDRIVALEAQAQGIVLGVQKVVEYHEAVTADRDDRLAVLREKGAL